LYNVLLVDDEPGHLAGLSKIMRKLRPDYHVHTAKNGEEALRCCYAANYEIIITDIQMPLMDGLEFFERLPGSRKPQKVIFLTGYDYFEYAQKAIGLGSFEYVLKPVDLHKFTQVLEKAEHSLGEQLASLREQEQLSARLDSIIPLYHNRILSLWAHGEPLSAAERLELEQALIEPGGGRIIAVACNTTTDADGERERVRAQLRSSLKALFAEHTPAVCFQSEQEHGLLVCALQTVPSADLMERLEAALRSHTNENVILVAGISDWAEALSASAPKLLQAARSAALEGYYAADRVVFASSDSRIDMRRLIKASTRDEAWLSDAVHAADVAASARTAAAKLLARLTEDAALPSPAELRLYCRKLLVKLVEAADYLLLEVREQLTADMAAELEQSRTVAELEQAIVSALTELGSTIQEARRDSKEAVIYKCLAYIDEHYMEDLSLESVSAMFHFNSSYFCQYFKSKLNINFSQYLTQTRLSKAKELLEQSNDKVYQVAAQLGYQDVKYFNRVFKKEFGLTPEEYRSIARSMKLA
jgi:two-component system response regulator YesN